MINIVPGMTYVFGKSGGSASFRTIEHMSQIVAEDEIEEAKARSQNPVTGKDVPIWKRMQDSFNDGVDSVDVQFPFVGLVVGGMIGSHASGDKWWPVLISGGTRSGTVLAVPCWKHIDLIIGRV